MQNTLEQLKQGRKSKFFWSDNKGLIFDSKGEAYFYLWINEMVDAKYIKSFTLQPEPFVLSEPIKRTYIKQLKTKTKLVEEHVESSQIYTADYKIEWEQKAFDDNLVIEFDSQIKKQAHHVFTFSGVSYIELKPDSMGLKYFDSENMVRLFRSKSKSVFEKFHVYINLLFHNKHFSNTFVPKRYLTGDKSMKERLIKYKIRTLEEFTKEVRVEPEFKLL